MSEINFEIALKCSITDIAPLNNIVDYIGQDIILQRGSGAILNVQNIGGELVYSQRDNGALVDYPVYLSNVTKIEFDIIGYYNCDGGFKRINGDTLIGVNNSGFSASGTYSYTHKVLNLGVPSQVDYLEIYAGGGMGNTIKFKNMVFTYEEPYNWQSVPSISGKNGILSLVTLDSESINDGEPVSGAAVSVFDQNPVSGNNVKDIVDGNTPLIPSAVDVTAAFIISNPPVGELASRILAAKKGSIPESIEDADKTVSIPANVSNVTMPGLDENSQYYFAIFVADAVGDTAVSDPKDIYTSGDEGWNYDYTGEIQTFVAPKTGIYKLESWGAQGGDATDGTLTARGGYGAYAVGEVLLIKDETIYINVGGQNGYGGGGNYTPPNNE